MICEIAACNWVFKAQEIICEHNFRHDINEYFIVALRDLKMTCLETDIQMFCTSKCINKLVFIQEESDEVKFEKVNKLKKWLKEYVVIFLKNEEWTLIEVNYN